MKRTDVEDLRRVLLGLDAELALSFAPAQSLLAGTLKDGKKILTCGTHASYLAQLLVVRYGLDRSAWPALSLSDPAVLTAIASECGYDRLYARQIEALGSPGDALVAFSTTGKEPTVLEAIATARHRGLRTLGISGSVGLNCDTDIRIPSGHPPRIHEVSLLVIHLLCQALEG